MPKKVVVHLNNAPPIMLRIDGDAAADGAGVGWTEKIDLTPGRNEVDADLWKRWLDRNQNHPLFAAGHLAVEEPKEESNAA